MSTQLELSEKWRRRLSLLPEGRMGSQHVDIILDTGRLITDVPVFNGQYVQLKDDTFTEEEIVDIVLHEGNTGRTSRRS